VPAPTRTYPGTDPFGITQVSPSTLTTAGGRVRITGRDLEPGVRVRVGDSTPANVVSYASGAVDTVTVVVPPMVAGTYDLLVSTVDGRSAALDDAVTLVGATASPAPSGPASPGAPGAPAPSAPAPSAPSPPATTTRPPAQPQPTQTPTPTPTSSTAAPAPTGPVVKTGPGGLRLVAAPRWAGVPAGAWTAAGCDTGCTGAVV
jgi:hypothetical protein